MEYGGGVRPQRQGAIESGERAFEPLLLGKDDAAIVQGLEIVGLNGQHTVIGRQRFIEALCCHQGMGVVAARGDIRRILLHRLVQQDDGFVITPLLRLEETQHMQGREAASIGAQHLPVRFFRLRQIAGAVGRYALFEQKTQLHP